MINHFAHVTLLVRFQIDFLNYECFTGVKPIMSPRLCRLMISIWWRCTTNTPCGRLWENILNIFSCTFCIKAFDFICILLCMDVRNVLIVLYESHRLWKTIGIGIKNRRKWNIKTAVLVFSYAAPDISAQFSAVKSVKITYSMKSAAD